MGIEFEGRAGAQLSRATIRAVFAAVAEDSAWHVVRRDEHELALRPAGQQGSETIVVEIDGATIYVLFHVATETQRESFLARVQAALAAQRVRCAFEEV